MLYINSKYKKIIIKNEENFMYKLGVGATLAVAQNAHKIRVEARPTPTIII